MLVTNFVYNYYVNHLRSFFISLGSGFVCPSGLFGVSGGTLRFGVGCGLSDKLVCVLFWCVYFLIGQRPSLQGEAETGRKLSASLNLFQLCGFLSNVFFSLDTPLVMYNTLGVGGLAIKSETYTKKNCCAWFCVPVLTQPLIRKFYMSLYNDDLENYEETVFYLEFQLTGSVNAVGSVLLKKFLMDTLNLSN